MVLRYSKRDVLILDFPEDTKKKSIKDFIHATYPPADKPYAIHYLEFPGAALLVPSNAPYARHYLVASNKNK